MFNGIWRDLIYAGRSLAKARAFTLVCVVSLGIGMAPVIAVPYGARLLRMPPAGVNTEGLVEVITTPRGARGARADWSYPDFVDLRDANTGIVMTGWAMGESEITPQDPREAAAQASTMFVSANFFRTIGVPLVRGPGFDEKTDGANTAEPVVIVGYRFWQNRLGSDPDIVGKTLTLDGTPHVVVGIAPEHFDGIDTKELVVPLQRHPRLRAGRNADSRVRTDRDDRWVYIRGRLSPGVTLEQASAAVSAVTSRLASQYPVTNSLTAGVALPYDPIGNLGRAQFRIVETVALTLTGTILVVVCLNISGMMQVRSAMRERELSIRQAIGASRGRLVQHLLSEAIILAGIGGALASVVLFNIPRVVAWSIELPFPVLVQQALRVDLSMLAICVGLCLATSLVFGLLPATRFSRPVIITSLKDDVGVGGFRVGRLHRVTAALQVAIAVPLIVMSGMSLDKMRVTATADLGFEPDLLYAAPLKLDPMANDSAGFRIRAVRDNLETASGVASATVAEGLPLDFRANSMPVSLADGAVAPTFVPVHVTRVGDDYLRTMGIPLLRGRGFTVDDRAGTELVTVISKPLADELFPNADAGQAIGRRLTLGADLKTQKTITIVGVTGDFPTSQMSTEREQLLLPLAQHTAPAVFVIARSAPGEQPERVKAALDNAIRELGPGVSRTVKTGDGVPYSTIVTGVWLRENSMRDFLVQSAVAGATGGVILMLAALGIYGVVGLMVATRTREIAVRAALGASRRRLIVMILFDVVKLVLPGVAVGLVLTAALVRINGENMGIRLSNMEPLAYVFGAATAVLVAVLASVRPVRRAASVDPIAAMRSV